ncbi:type II toxin-antitoxin system VapC family toxin [Candidatus Microgenomates bacterium]|nr:type II toxin-antitoxin system VapC family toxin [Candidatus Microgenomates bacterium]
MRYLLDTNILLWWLDDDRKLKPLVRNVIQDKKNQILISIISGIEISIKNKLGRLPLKTNVKRIFEKSGFDILSVNLDHILKFDKLPIHKDHKDPFDRILIAQASEEKLTLITSDNKFQKYKLSLLKS